MVQDAPHVSQWQARMSSIGARLASATMTSPCRPLWALLALPVLVGAVLLMHGLDAEAAEAHAAPAATDGPVSDGQHHDGRQRCASCTVGHVAAVCVAVLAGATALVVATRRSRPRGAGVARPLSASLRTRIQPSTRPERPPLWVELAVMTC